MNKAISCNVESFLALFRQHVLTEMPISQRSPIRPGQGTVSSTLLGMLFEHCAENGLDPSDLDDMADLPRGAPRKTAGRLPFETFASLCALAGDTLRQPEFGIRMGLQVRPDHLGKHGQVLATCGSYRELTRLTQRYSRIVMDGFQNVLVENDSHILRTWQNDNGPGGHDILQDELNVAIWIGMASRILGSKYRKPLWVSFRHSPRFDPLLYERLLGTEVRFQSPNVSVAMNRFDPDLRLPGSVPEENRRLEAECQRELAHLMAGTGMVLGAAYAIMECALPDIPSLPDVAHTLALSPRQLRYQLKVRGMNYGHLADLVRYRCATQLLLAGHRLVDISAALGFSEQSAFNRAYRRWSQISPGKARTCQSDEPEGTVMRKDVGSIAISALQFSDRRI